ncbi:hypothetical protein [uncultured Hymenobacter sp.]|uniref:hypothetical protein n=1 Tax=uncultured Hymenobacter sp. TaxID=170016 RepID=UPI0035CBE30A
MEAQIEQHLEKIMPEDLARTFESAYHVLQGRHEHMDDLLKHGGTLLRKAAQRFTSTQLILGIAGIATVAVVLINRAQNDEHEEGQGQDVTPRTPRPRLSQSKQDQPKGQSPDND